MNQRTVLVHARGSMHNNECAFWDAVADACAHEGAALWLLTHNIIKGTLRAPYAQLPNGLDAIAPTDRCCQLPGWVDPDALLEREILWRGAPLGAAHEAHRVRAIGMYAQLYEAAVRISNPGLCVIWNGHHPQEMILRTACQRHGIPTLWLERGPIPGTVQLDPIGILGGSSSASCRSIGEAAPEWQTLAQQLCREHLPSAWEQPENIGAQALRAQLGISHDDTVVFFAGQADADAQGFLYGNGCSNAHAFARFVEALPDHDNLFILGKHHPRSNLAPSEYTDLLRGRRGAWVTDVSVHDCLSVADRVAAVNSTVLFEALCAGKPVLSMGLSLLSGKRIAYHFGADSMEDWLGAPDRESRHARWIAFLAHLLERSLYSMKPEADSSPWRGAESFARHMLEHALDDCPVPRDEMADHELFGQWTGYGAIGGDCAPWPEQGAAINFPAREAHRV